MLLPKGSPCCGMGHRKGGREESARWVMMLGTVAALPLHTRTVNFAPLQCQSPTLHVPPTHIVVVKALANVRVAPIHLARCPGQAGVVVVGGEDGQSVQGHGGGARGGQPDVDELGGDAGERGHVVGGVGGAQVSWDERDLEHQVLRQGNGVGVLRMEHAAVGAHTCHPSGVQDC